MNNKVLCLLHLTPPCYGETILNTEIINGSLAQKFCLDAVAINTSKVLKDIESFSMNKLLIFIQIILTVLKKLIKNQYSFCYFSITPAGIGFYKDLCLVVLVKLFRVRILYHLHGKGFSSQRRILNNIFYKYCFKDNKTIVVSKSLSYDIAKYVNRSAIYVLPNATKNNIDDCNFNKIINNRLSRNSCNLLFLSNMIESKGVYIALKSAEILRKKGHNFKFYFVGEWYDVDSNNFFRKVKEYDLTDLVQYLGFKSGNEKYDVLKASDVFVYPTCKDIFGIVNIEAMQFGLPVVSTFEGAIPEIVDDGITGFLVAQKDYRMLAEKIEILINDPDLRIRMGRAARAKFLATYTFDKFEEQLDDIFNEVINNRFWCRV